MVSIRRAYGGVPIVLRHPLPGGVLAALTLLVAALCQGGVWRALGVPAAALAALVGARCDRWRWRALIVAATLALVADGRASAGWRSLAPDDLSPVEGWVTVVNDPQPLRSATRVVVEVGGERFEVWVRGRASQVRAERWRAGERLLVAGTRSALDAERQRRVAWQHVVGELELDWVADSAYGSPLARAANVVRATLEGGAEAAMGGEQAALFRGLVVGDDRDQPAEMIDRFRASGLSHLTAVSGQNVAFVLAAAGPLVRRLRPWWRWAVTVGLIAWFAALTRFEPSILRAGAMAILSATGWVLGRERSAGRLLCVAVIGLLLVDPLLVASIGFWLSVGATAGVTVIAPRLAPLLDRLGWMAQPLAVTLGAQAGVLLPAGLVFGGVPLMSVPANLLAVPVAGVVMLYGLPAGLVAGLVPPAAPVVLAPCRVGVRWIDLVAALGAAIEPGRRGSLLGWLVLIGVLAAISRTGCRRPPRRPPRG
jgi:competence protein ComEC